MDCNTGEPESRQGRGQMGRGTILNHMVIDDLTEMETFQLKKSLWLFRLQEVWGKAGRPIVTVQARSNGGLDEMNGGQGGQK